MTTQTPAKKAGSCGKVFNKFEKLNFSYQVQMFMTNMTLCWYLVCNRLRQGT